MSEYDAARRIHYPGSPVSVTDWAEARSIAREHLPIEHGDARRWEHDADRIRRALALPTYRDHRIEMSCFNRDDARQIERRLQPAERLRVLFTYPKETTTP